MSLEHTPVLLGAVVALLGLALIADGWFPDSAWRMEERRRRARLERDRAGEVAIGLGILALAAALFGRDQWRWGTVAVLAGVVLLLAGILRNRRFLAERLVNRGKSRRGRRRERRAERTQERLVPLMVAQEAERRTHDRRGEAGEEAADAGDERQARAPGRSAGGRAQAPLATVADRPAPRSSYVHRPADL